MTAFTPTIFPYAELPSSECVNPSGYIDNRALAANTAESITIPAGVTQVFITCTVNTWIAYTFTGFDDATAAVPSSDTTDGSGVELIYAGNIPTKKFLGNVSKISLISGATCLVSLVYYR